VPRFLLRRYGRLYLQFEEPISLRALAEQRLGAAAASLTLEEDGERETDSKRTLVRSLANRVAYGINRAITITPVGLLSAAILSHVRRGIGAEEVSRRVELLRYIAAEGGARFARGLSGAPSDPRAPGPIADALAKLAADGLVKVEQAAGQTILQVSDEKRPLLDYHRNTVLHRYVSLSLLAAALRACGGDATVEAVRVRARWLSRLFKLEFMYRVGATHDAVFEEVMGYLSRLGVLERTDGRLRAGPERETLEFLADLTRSYLEAYCVVARALAAAGATGAPIERKALVKDALERGRADFLAGRLLLRESLSTATIENAVEWFALAGAMTPHPEGRWRLDDAWKASLLTELVDEMGRFLGP
jgi:glycerol-3-phosphate O-acyltransferase